LAGISYIEQQVTRLRFYLNESVTRLSSLMIQADRPKCKESHIVLRSPENTKRVIYLFFIPPKNITVHYRY